MDDVKKTKIFYLLRTQYENLGDLVINRICISLLRQRGELRVNVVGVPRDFVDQLDLSEHEAHYDDVAFYRTLAASARSGGPTFLALVPGASLGSYTGPQALRHLGLVAAYAALKAQGVRLVRLGASIGPYAGIRRSIEKLKSRMMIFTGYRDSESLTYAKAHGFQNFGSFPDMAFMLPFAAHDDAEAAAPYLIVSVRTHAGVTPAYLAGTLGPLIDRLDPQRRHHIVILYQVGRDRQVCMELSDLLADRPTSVFDGTRDEPALFRLYRQANGVLSNRLHVLLFALSQSARVIALVDPNKDQKIIGIFKDAGLSGRLVRIDNESELRSASLDDQGDIAALFSRRSMEAQAALDTLFKV